MNVRGFILPAVVVAAGLLTVASAAQPAGARARRPAPPEPVVVELFTAQGCAGCPEANQLVEGFAREPGVIALTYPVDYWDYLGWADTLARPEFTERQQAYRQALELRAIATPQIIIDGRRAASAEPGGLREAVDEEAARRVWPPEVEFRQGGARVGVGSGRAPAGGAEVVAVVYTPGPQSVRVESGDNRGKTVRHVNVVQRIVKLGDWTGQARLYALPDDLEAEAGVVVLVQDTADRLILTARAR